MHQAPLPCPVVEFPRRRWIKAQRIAWRIAFAVSDALVLGAAVLATLLFIAAVFRQLPPIA